MVKTENPPTESKVQPKPSRTKPQKILPTDRLTIQKQLDILRAYAIVRESSPEKGITNNDVATIVQLKSSTISYSNAFFVDVGFLQRLEGGYIPSSEVMTYKITYEWDPDSAAQKLAPIIKSTWFAQALLPKVQFRQLEEKEALTTLAEAASADTSYKAQLRTLLDYLEYSGLTVRDGNLIKAPGKNGTPSHQEDLGSHKSLKQSTHIEGLENFPPSPSPFEGIEFNVSIRVDMKELTGWEAERISSFMNGLAQVITAKGKLDDHK